MMMTVVVVVVVALPPRTVGIHSEHRARSCARLHMAVANGLFVACGGFISLRPRILSNFTMSHLLYSGSNAKLCVSAESRGGRARVCLTTSHVAVKSGIGGPCACERRPSIAPPLSRRLGSTDYRTLPCHYIVCSYGYKVCDEQKEKQRGLTSSRQVGNPNPGGRGF